MSYLSAKDHEDITTAHSRSYAACHCVQQSCYNIVGAVAATVPASQNELIDALECLASLAILSGMTIEQKIRYVDCRLSPSHSNLLIITELVACPR